MDQVRIQDVDLAVEEHGDGPSMVLVHGSVSDLRTWQAQLSEFGNDYRVICYSRRYHWPNRPAADGGRYSMREQTDDLRAVLHALSAEPAHLVGHSYGAYLCLRLALERPDLVRSLVLVEPPAFRLVMNDPSRPSELIRLLVTSPRTALSMTGFGTRSLGPARKAADRGDLDRAARVFGTGVLGAKAFARMSEERWRQVLANNIQAEYLTADYLPLPAEQLRRLTTPTLLVTGADSPRLFHRLMDRLDELLPNRRRIEISNASHIVHEDNPAEFDAAIRAFLNGDQSSGSRPR